MALAIPSQGQTESRASAPVPRHRRFVSGYSFTVCRISRFVSGYGFSHTVSGQTESRASAPVPRHRCFVSGYGFSHTVPGANREPGFRRCASSSPFRIRVWLHPPLCPVVAVSYQGMALAIPSRGKQRAGLQPLRPVIAVSYQDMASPAAVPRRRRFVSGYSFTVCPRISRFVSGYGFSRRCAPSSPFHIRV